MFNLDADFRAFDSFIDDDGCDFEDLDFTDLSEDVERETNMAAEFPQLAINLRQKGASLVRLEYEGRDGAGRFLHLRCFGAEYQELQIELPGPMLDELREFCAIKLNDAQPNWTAEHGSCGDFGWDLKANALSHYHRPFEQQGLRSPC